MRHSNVGWIDNLPNQDMSKAEATKWHQVSQKNSTNGSFDTQEELKIKGHSENILNPIHLSSSQQRNISPNPETSSTTSPLFITQSSPPPLDHEDGSWKISKLPSTEQRLICRQAKSKNIVVPPIMSFLSIKNTYKLVEKIFYIAQPTSYSKWSTRVCKLWKALYSLKQSPRIWYKTLAKFLHELSFRSLNADHGLFAKKDIYIAIYIDNLLICGAERKDINNVKKTLKAKFHMSDLRPVSFHLGIAVTQNRATQILYLGQ